MDWRQRFGRMNGERREAATAVEGLRGVGHVSPPVGAHILNLLRGFPPLFAREPLLLPFPSPPVARACGVAASS